jgi:hypothetical protein
MAVIVVIAIVRMGGENFVLGKAFELAQRSLVEPGCGRQELNGIRKLFENKCQRLARAVERRADGPDNAQIVSSGQFAARGTGLLTAEVGQRRFELAAEDAPRAIRDVQFRFSVPEEDEVHGRVVTGHWSFVIRHSSLVTRHSICILAVTA